MNALPNFHREIDTINAISPYPAAGKGTLAQGLRDEFSADRLVEFGVGDMVRKHKKSQTAFGKMAQEYEQKGMLVPDEMIVANIRRGISILDPQKLWLLDGFPRSQSQIGAYEELMDELGRKDHFFLLDVPREVAELRMIRRGKAVAAAGDTPRADDVDSVVRKTRLDTAERDMKPIIDRYGELGKLTVIDGTQSIEQVLAQVRAAIFASASAAA